jgi:arylsulfatase A-like enzyme
VWGRLVSSDEVDSAENPVTDKPVRQPNVLMIFVDSVRADHLSCYGYERDTSPNIDRIAREGCLFETAITAAPFSPAAYASVFSNLYTHQHGVNGDTVRVWPNHFTRLAEKMKANGYDTFGISNNDFVSSGCNAIAGFDEYVDVWRPPFWIKQHERLRRRVRKYLGRKAARWLDINATQCVVKGDSEKSIRLVEERISRSSRPFFGFVLLMDPHAPYNKKHTHFLDSDRHTRKFFSSFNDAYMWVQTMAGARELSPQQVQIALDCYDSEIRHADECVGNLYSWLSRNGLLDDTVIIVAADHGEGFGEHDVWGHGFCLNDCLTRVPLVLR